jgi:hypothetical protein
MDPVIEIDLNKLSEPQQYNTVLFQMNAYTEILKNMTESAKKVNPKLIVADQVNISSMCSLSFHNKIFGAPHDWERHSDFLDTVSMDLYNAPRDYYKYWNKYQCAMFNNKKAVMLITGCTTAYDKVASAIAFPLMWGVKVVEFFPPRNTDIVKAWQEAGRTFSYFNFTGLGDLLVRSNPQKHVALLRDRAGMINAIKTGQWMRGRGNLYDDKIAQMTYIKNLQTDIIMSKYFNSNNLKDYPLLYIVDNPVISDKFIDTIAEYVKNGGNAIIEGKGIRNKRMQKLAGVSFSGKIYDISNNVNGFCPFKFTGKICQILPLDGNVLCKFADGTPVLTEKKLGKGKILYLAPIISSKISAQDDISYFIRNLFRRLAGKQIITIENDDINEIDSNIMTDGKGNYIFCAWNPDFETKTVKIKWNGSSRPEVIINFANGSVSEFKEIFSFELPQDQIKQFFIGKNGIVNIPEHNVLSPGNIPDYSSEPNKDILNYKLEKKSNCAVKHSPKLDGTSYVAVFKPVIMGKNISTGAKSIYNSLLNLRGINVEYINDLNPETISYYDAVIIPNIGYHSVSKDWECNIREYVLNGGSVFLNHRTVGYAPCKFPPFPEIGKNSISGVVPQRDIKIVMQHPLTNKLAVRKRYPDDYNNPAFQTQIDLNAFKVGDSYQFGFCDYVPLKPGKNGAVIARSCKNNDPVIIAGKTGKGKAVLAGMSIGQDEKGREKINVNDKKILINSIYWLTEKID